MQAHNTYNEQELLSQFAGGSEGATRQLYERFYRPLCWYAEKLVNQKQEAEDIALDSFVKLLSKRTDFSSLGELQAFLYTATRNACYNFLRDRGRHEASHEELRYLSENAGETKEDLEQLTAKVLSLLYTEMEKLPSQSKAVFKGIFIDGKTTAELAAELGISPQTVLNQKARALQQLRLSLYKEGLYSAAIFMHCLALLSLSGQG